ncbi:ElyC/SanA/YdcF family protein [Bacillus sp. JJ1609]|uniref:ElyC/SanA/YdcF family protein n=1 Tax=Bacillus sp. JJ1609 TaxID=3122977 RepID=UPI002FFDE97F
MKFSKIFLACLFTLSVMTGCTVDKDNGERANGPKTQNIGDNKEISNYEKNKARVSTVEETDNIATPVKNDEPTSRRINHFKDIAMYYYWHGGDIKQAEKDIFKGITLKGKYDVVENAFREATLLDPYDLDLKFSLASTQLIQKKYPETLQTFTQILNLDPNNFKANLLYGAYSKVNGDQNSYKRSMSKLRQIDSARSRVYEQKLASADSLMKVKINTSPPADLPQQNHAIVILGYALADDGTMKEPLIERLKAGLAIAKKYPNSKIIVTGGVPKQGVTEADAMNKWLTEQGVAQERILLENKSTDTVENALFSTAILEKQGLKDVTIVTSASHIRRALTVFNETSKFFGRMNNKNTDRNFTNVVYLDYPSVEEAQKVSKDEIFVIYRDLFRASGIWQYPGLQR